MKNFEVFKETCLPFKEAFRNDLTETTSLKETPSMLRMFGTQQAVNRLEIIMICTSTKIFSC